MSTTATNPWDLAIATQQIHRFSTLFEAGPRSTHLHDDAGIERAVAWCRDSAVTKVYLESFRNGYHVPRDVLTRARDRLRSAGLDVSGCVTPTRIGRPSSRWKLINCYTDESTQAGLAEVFQVAAALFDEVMIDDFWFTDCFCAQCDGARRARTVRACGRSVTVDDDSWDAYRCELMVQLSRHVLDVARGVNPRCRLIIKYPQWYDRFHERGYDVVRQTRDFDRTWAGTETRDPHRVEWNRTPQYEAYFVMRWLGAVGGGKCGGGWYDPYGTTERTYIEQARQTILGGARESLLFCYGSLQRDTGPANSHALRQEISELQDVAAQVQRHSIRGIAAYKPPSSPGGAEFRIFSFLGMLGLPLVPCHEFPADAPAALLTTHALADPQLLPRLSAYVASGRPVMLTEGLGWHLAGRAALDAPNVVILPTGNDPYNLLELDQPELDRLRSAMLAPLGLSFEAPNRVGFYSFDDGSWVVENFNDEPIEARVNGQRVTVSPRQWTMHWA